MHRENPSTNILGMKLTVPHTYVEDRSQVVEIHTLAEVVKVQRSSAGFKTSTGTTRTCERCRGEKGVAGVEPWPVGTWLLTAEVFRDRQPAARVFKDRRVIQLVLCPDHFKELRDEERNLSAGEPLDSQEHLPPRA